MTTRSLVILLLISLNFSYSKSIEKTIVDDVPATLFSVTFVEDTICPGESATLIIDAGSNGIVQWMDEGKVIHMGDTLKTRPLQKSKTFKATYKTKRKGELRTVFLTATVEQSSRYYIMSLPEEVDNPDQEIQFLVNKYDSIKTFIWNFGERGQDTLAVPSRNFKKAGKYELGVEITTLNGCVFQLEKKIEIKRPPYLDFPSAFSPNGDGFNDLFKISHYELKSFVMKIYNRQGELIYETENPDFVWDGVDIFGEETPEGVYSCRVNAITESGESLSKQLTLTLIR
ncbi:MAG: gliding motility-associated C-terminal domain-containing protein [Bacteroidia bacterium]|nr:gliding motility-associated C-terminal domain-containing protein [Bacteroidia bacterium]